MATRRLETGLAKDLANQPVDDLGALSIAIGQQVRAFRNQQDMTAVDCAKQANLSPAMLSKIENGNASPSLTTLHSLSRALNVPLTGFFRRFEEQRGVRHTLAGQGVVIERRGSRVGHVYELLGYGIGKQLAIAPHLVTLTDESEEFSLFQHTGIEFIYMLEGEMIYQHAEEQFRLQPGDSLFFEADVPHGPSKLVKLPIRFLSIIGQLRGDNAESSVK
ncbi:MAG: helix-turn-helix domain-containing protein [Woeseia sp.]